MAFKIKTWVDRVSEYPTRRILTKADGSTETVTVARSEGEVSNEGDAFSAKNMNDLEQRILEGIPTNIPTITLDTENQIAYIVTNQA